MKPDKLPLVLPKDTPVILVDPLNDFLDPEGIFAKVYSLEDTKPIRDLLPVLREMAKEWRYKTKLILCRSLYRRDEFGVPGLEELCTENNIWGRDTPMLNAGFKYEFEKRHNSILMTDDEEIRDILASVRHAIMVGMTLTSCMAKSKAQVNAEIPDLTLVIPRDTTGVRASRAADGEALFQEWEAAEEERVIVPASWRDITFARRPGERK